MTSCGPNTQSLNFTHMFDIIDKRGKYPIEISCPNSLLDIIKKNPDFSRFYYMVKLSQLENILNCNQANFTIFIPSDKALSAKVNDNIFINMDKCTAFNIVKSSMLNNRLSSEILEDCPEGYYYTVSEANRLYITNISGQTYIDNNIRIIKKDILAMNGIIHITDNIIIPIII
jgi:uncharacterized surface protein with fasciclin (FAS1) repeats